MNAEEMFTEIEKESLEDAKSLRDFVEDFIQAVESPDFIDCSNATENLIRELDNVQRDLVILRAFQIAAKRAISK